MEGNIERETPTVVELIEVIHVTTSVGAGTKENPVREVNQYWAKNGELLAER